MGDTVLHAVATAVAAQLRTTDTAYRYGGEEIAVLLRETGGEEAVEVAERVRRAVAGLVLPTTDVTVTASVGVASMTGAMIDHRDLIGQADAALYDAKRNGRDRPGRGPLRLSPGAGGYSCNGVDQPVSGGPAGRCSAGRGRRPTGPPPIRARC